MAVSPATRTVASRIEMTLPTRAQIITFVIDELVGWCLFFMSIYQLEMLAAGVCAGLLMLQL